MTDPTTQAATLDTQIAELTGQADKLRATLAGRNYRERAAAREELADVERTLSVAQTDRAALDGALEAAQQRSTRAAARLAAARQLLTDAPHWFQHPRRTADTIAVGSIPPIATLETNTAAVLSFHLGRKIDQARALLRAAGEPVPDTITIEL